MRAYGRVIGPTRAISKAFLDLKTIPLAQRKKYIVRTKEGQLFDELQFLADYERAKPGVFAPRDEKLQFRAYKEDVAFKSEVDKTEVAGVYRAGAYFEGYLVRGCMPPEYFVRTVSAETSLGVRLDPNRSRTKVRWLGPRQFEVTFTPMDRFGNILSPTSIAMPTLRLRGRELRANYESRLDGTHRLLIDLLEGDAKPKGKSYELAAKAKFAGVEGTVEVEAGESISLTIDVVGQTLPVSAIQPDAEK